MPKELFNQPLIIVEPDANDRTAFGQPSVVGGKNMVWSVFKTIVKAFTSIFDWLDLTPQDPAPTHTEGRLFYNDVKKSFSGYIDELDVVADMPYEFWIRVYNNSGATIINGSIVYPSGVDVGSGLVTIALANAHYREKSRLVGMATHDIGNNSIGIITRLGAVGGLNTTGLTGVIYLSDVTDGAYTQNPPVDGSYVVAIGAVGVVDAANGTIIVDPNVSELTVEATDTNGFPPNQKNNTTLSVNNGIRTFSIAPITGTEFHLYQLGRKYEITGTDSVVFPDTEGTHWFYYDEGVLTVLTNPTPAQSKNIILNKCFIAEIYWDATANAHQLDIFEERHGISMSPETHVYLHLTRGAQYLSGYILGNFVADGNGSLNTHAQFSATAGAFVDEDITHIFSGKSVGDTIPVVYLEGANGDLRSETNTGFAISYNPAGTIYYNQFTGGVWQKTEVGSNNFCLYHIFTLNGVTEQIMSVMGQNEYATLSAARDAAVTEISSIVAAFTLPEVVPVATVIFKANSSYTNTPSAAIQSVSAGVYYVNWIDTELSQGAAPTNHQNLAELQLAANSITFGHIDDQSQTIAGAKTFSDAATFDAAVTFNSSQFDATIGVGGDYAEPADAIAAGKKRMKFLSNVSATKTTTCSGFTIIDCNGYTFTFTGQIFTLSADTRIKGIILGNLTISVNSCVLIDFTLTGNLIISADYIKFTNNICTGLLTLAAGSEFNVITGNTLTGGLTDSSGATNNEINNNVE